MPSVAQLLLEREYPDHVCPDEMEPTGSPRQGMHSATGGGMLNFVCVVGTACGCDVVGTGTLQHPMMVEPCDEHRAAMYPQFA